jgi:hypothetical protein
MSVIAIFRQPVPCWDFSSETDLPCVSGIGALLIIPTTLKSRKIEISPECTTNQEESPEQTQKILI